MRLYTYVVARDFGFAPNPFYGVCTLATCKPVIRANASVGDWIVGTGSKERALAGRLVFAMEVTETLSHDEYWEDARFLVKRPSLSGSLKQAFGDNIYHRDPRSQKWVMADSHHSLNDGSPNPVNIEHDLRFERVLLSTNYTYWGGCGPPVPNRFEELVCSGQGHRCNFELEMVNGFVTWLKSQERGYRGRPLEWIEGRAIRRATPGALS